MQHPYRYVLLSQSERPMRSLTVRRSHFATSFALRYKPAGTTSTMMKAQVVSPWSSVPPSLLTVCIVLLARFVSMTEAVACGTSGFQNFASNGNDLRAAASCYVLGTSCGAVGGSKAAVQGTYGDDISYWCTGLVTDFRSVFRNMTVSDYPK